MPKQPPDAPANNNADGSDQRKLPPVDGEDGVFQTPKDPRLQRHQEPHDPPHDVAYKKNTRDQKNPARQAGLPAYKDQVREVDSKLHFQQQLIDNAIIPPTGVLPTYKDQVRSVDPLQQQQQQQNAIISPTGVLPTYKDQVRAVDPFQQQQHQTDDPSFIPVAEGIPLSSQDHDIDGTVVDALGNVIHSSSALSSQPQASGTKNNLMKVAVVFCVALLITAAVVATLTVFSGGNGEDSSSTVVKLTGSDSSTGDQFALSVAISGDTIAIGSHGHDENGSNSGSVYIYVRSIESSSWTEQAKLVASDGSAGDHFGYSVGIDGDTVVVGAYGDDTNGDKSGSTYVYQRLVGTLWTEQAKLLPSNASADDHFGYSVAVDGDTIVIGAMNDDENALDSGSAYLYTRVPSGSTVIWTEQQKLLASDGASNDLFGISVAISADTVVVGAYLKDNHGCIYIFIRSYKQWNEKFKLQASNAAANSWFGYEVAIDGGTIVVGAPGKFDAGIHGSAYIFVRLGTDWMEQTELVASSDSPDDLFASAVSVSANTIVIGAQTDDDNGQNSGSVYIYTQSDSTMMWTEQMKLVASDATMEDTFGVSVAVDGATAVIGADWDDDTGSDSGSAYVFRINQV